MVEDNLTLLLVGHHRNSDIAVQKKYMLPLGHTSESLNRDSASRPALKVVVDIVVTHDWSLRHTVTVADYSKKQQKHHDR